MDSMKLFSRVNTFSASARMAPGVRLRSSTSREERSIKFSSSPSEEV